MGRHSAPEPEPESEADVGMAAPAATGSRADLQLLRTDGRLRLRCAGAVVLTFLIFTAVLVLLGRTDVYPIWLWIPIVTSGVLVGALLDAAHRTRARAHVRSDDEPATAAPAPTATESERSDAD